MNNNPYEASNSQQYDRQANDPDRNVGTPYANPNDQPLMVPKRFGWGYSFNWSNPKAVMLFFGLILVIVILVAVVVPVVLRLVMR
ncbi:MAG TPA: DUF5808 domain-containing protein [Ktedonobacteraceae bacterium]|nr:DUF5808 domain-containing protein [Ktedonobacteraceae bacterium]